MHWKGLRIFFDGNNESSKKPSPINSVHHGEKLPDVIDTDNSRPPSRLPFLSFRHSESIPRLPPFADPEEERRLGNGSDDQRPPGRSSSSRLSADWQTVRRNRFSFWRHRHASDPQLATSYEKGEANSVPPVPPLPPRKITPLACALFFFFFFFFFGILSPFSCRHLSSLSCSSNDCDHITHCRRTSGPRQTERYPSADLPVSNKIKYGFRRWRGRAGASYTAGLCELQSSSYPEQR